MYKVEYPEIGFRSSKHEYEAGEEVEVVYYLLASETSYTFDANVEDLEKTYENGNVVLRFIMPTHDVTITLESGSIMMYRPEGYNGLAGFGMGMMNTVGIVPTNTNSEEKEIKNGAEDKFCRICGEKRINHAKYCTNSRAVFG